MKPIFIFLIYIIGFIIFYQAMSYLDMDEKILFFLKPNPSKVNKIKPKQQKEGDILTPKDAKKPLKLTKQEIGRNAWALLHSIASSYPNDPNEEDKKNIINFLKGLAHNFPCKICGKHFVKLLDDYPIKCDNREQLVYYICDIHNKVNKFLKKEIFDCKKAFDVWGGDCGCSV